MTTISTGSNSPEALSEENSYLLALLRRSGISTVWHFFLLNIEKERERWGLWAPVVLSIGIIGYFSLPFEPWISVSLILVLSLIGALTLSRSYPTAVTFSLMAGILLLLGFLAAQIETWHNGTPMLARTLMGTVTGKVLSLDKAERGYRLILKTDEIEKLDISKTPKLLRLFVPQRFGEPPLGATIKTRVDLAPLSPPAMPGSFDFQRYGFFAGIGGSGVVIQNITTLSSPHSSNVFLAIEKLRNAINQRIRENLGGYQGGMATALLTGAQTNIPRPLLDSMRDSGLAHLLSISGLHMGLVAAFIFALIRGGLALCPWVALRFNTKKWAAVVAIVAAFAYLLVAEAPVPTLRAFFMTGLAILAILLDRISISMNLISWAGVAVLLIAPDSLLGPSFQMSFFAVLMMVAAYEAPIMRKGFIGKQAGLIGQGIKYVLSVAGTTLVASIAILPAGIYHFNQIQFYGLAANLIAVPVTGLWVMPWGVVSLLAMPFGLEHWPLIPMGWGVMAIAETANTVAAWPGSTATLPAMPDSAYAATTFGMLWICLWQRSWRWLGLIGIVAGVTLTMMNNPPDIIVSQTGKLIAVRTTDGSLQIANIRSNRFTAEIWLDRNGSDEALPWPKTYAAQDDESPQQLNELTCDAKGCIYRQKERTVGFAFTPEALHEDCSRVDLMIILTFSSGDCHPRDGVINRQDLRSFGTHALWLPKPGTKQAIRIESVNKQRGTRPWVPRFEKSN